MSDADVVTEKDRQRSMEEYEDRVQATVARIRNRVVVFSGKGGSFLTNPRGSKSSPSPR